MLLPAVLFAAPSPALPPLDADRDESAVELLPGGGSFSSLPAALTAAREARRGATNGAMTLLIHGGRHFLAAPLTLTPDDSGLTLAAAPGEWPVVTSGHRIAGWQPVAGRTNAWAVTLPDVRDGRWYFRSLFVNGRRATRARTPNTGYFQMVGARFNDDPVKFQFHPGDLRPAWAADPDLEVVGLEKWTTFRQHITALDTVSNRVTLSFHAASWTRTDGARYFVENTPDALDAPGEWYLDRRTGVLTYLARPGEDPRSADIWAPTLRQLVFLQADAAARRPVRDLTLRGLVLAGTDWDLPPAGHVDVQAAVNQPACLSATGAVHCVVTNCTFIQLGGYAVDLGRGCQEDRVSHCQFIDVGAGGVRIGEQTIRPEPFDQNFGHEISDNEMAQLGRVNYSAVGVLVLQSGRNHVAHNEIRDLYYTAISVGWTWGYGDSPCRENIIEFNHLHQLGQGVLSDMGGVYTLGPQRGTVVRNNLIHDITCHSYGGWGLYTDEGSSWIVLESNVVYHCQSGGFHQHYGMANVVRNNIFALNPEHELVRTRVEPHISFYLTNNIVLFNSGDLLSGNWSGSFFVIGRNVYYDTRLGANQTAMTFAGQSWAAWHDERGFDAESVLGDPRFVAPEAFDFHLKPDAPALRLGFHPIDLSTVGVRPPQ